MRLTVIAFGIGGALIAGPPTPVTAQEMYPWCVQGETLHCYYATREQCELTVDYHGFCVANPEAAPIDQSAHRAYPPGQRRGSRHG